MGGIGSGRNEGFPPKAQTTEYQKIDIRDWVRRGLLHPSNSFLRLWSFPGDRLEAIAVDVYEDSLNLTFLRGSRPASLISQSVALTRTSLASGGERTWFRCPITRCQRRCAVLYLRHDFACRTCHDLVYPSQRVPVAWRRWERNFRLRMQGGG